MVDLTHSPAATPSARNWLESHAARTSTSSAASSSASSTVNEQPFGVQNDADPSKYGMILRNVVPQEDLARSREEFQGAWTGSKDDGQHRWFAPRPQGHSGPCLEPENVGYTYKITASEPDSKRRTEDVTALVGNVVAKFGLELIGSYHAGPKDHRASWNPQESVINAGCLRHPDKTDENTDYQAMIVQQGLLVVEFEGIGKIKLNAGDIFLGPRSLFAKNHITRIVPQETICERLTIRLKGVFKKVVTPPPPKRQRLIIQRRTR